MIAVFLRHGPNRVYMSLSQEGFNYSDAGLVLYYQRKKLMQAFWTGTWSVLTFAVVVNESSEIKSILATLLVGIAVLIPVY
ncbi:MAG: hypothetical protein ACRD8W_28210, partial [Nitrososphaeraceae archaeon]